MFTVDKKTRWITCNEGYKVLLDFKKISYSDNNVEIVLFTDELLNPNKIEIYKSSIQLLVDNEADNTLSDDMKNVVISRVCSVLDFIGVNYSVTE